MVGSRYKVGADGKMPYGRLRGCRCTMVAVPFGENVYFKQPKENDSRVGHNMESDWMEGVWVGHVHSTSETTTGTSEGDVRAWAVKRKPGEERWTSNAIKK